MWRVGHSHDPGVPLGGQRGSPGSAHPERLHGQATSTGTHSTGTVSALTSLPRGHNPATTAPPAARAWCGAFGKHSTQEMPDHRWTTDRSPAPQGPTASAHTLPLPGGQGCPGPCRPPGSAFVLPGALHPCPVNRTSETNSEPSACPLPHREDWACGILGGADPGGGDCKARPGHKPLPQCSSLDLPQLSPAATQSVGIRSSGSQ